MPKFVVTLVVGGAIAAGAEAATMKYEFTGTIESTGAFAAYSGGTFTYRSFVNELAADLDGTAVVGSFAQSKVELVIHQTSLADLVVFSFGGANLATFQISTANQTIKSELVTATFQFASVVADPIGITFGSDALPGPFAQTAVVAAGSTSYFSFLDIASGVTMTTTHVSAELIPLPTPVGLACAGLLGVFGARRRR